MPLLLGLCGYNLLYQGENDLLGQPKLPTHTKSHACLQQLCSFSQALKGEFFPLL